MNDSALQRRLTGGNCFAEVLQCLLGFGMTALGSTSRDKRGEIISDQLTKSER